MSKLISFMLSFMGIMAAGPVLLLFWVFILKGNIELVFARHPIGVSLVFALYMGFVCFMFFWLQDRFIVFRPTAATIPLSKTDLVDHLERAFNSPVDGQKLFDFKKDENKVVVTWAASTDYFQVAAAGKRGMKRVIVLTLDEKDHDVFFLMQDKDWKWNLSQGFFDFSLNYSTGIFAEFVTERYPSIEFSRDSGLRVDIKKLSYSSNDLWLPVQAAVLSCGWTLRGGMLPKFFHRILFCLPLALTFFGCMYLITMIADGQPSKDLPGETAAGSKGARWDVKPELTAQLKNSLQYLETANIESHLQEIMEVRKEHLNDYHVTTFIVYAKGYFSRKDKKADFEQKLRAFGKENEIGGLGP